ncbi:nicotinate-nucleotide--dimethylbenzimidazole phosphoribosyltransferase [Pelagovum pacificum]|uniref:Nicotinate-nucleotide--dimethylbenzimidazole phosphoribosyltransferase n=1 Tax=Pelagovum pacificum TaxID=2588711 RepID=A0A5C5GH87_9RHOB|nr:nicotinate-nucleotide--dimethylbenzimidazole phosphoribosyltransferase [Pelagovum pacificum]QQA44005.1 nicotinate-nucleotide--dimethylbenzimidazole phosphoribosyltransferase [Pelagovum pacificum]TNY32866.1 nicotinate-nucleotide--dimethylbenzimidazole phosphoribosyltransferase [Pelagovum pacificum]
MSSPFTTIKAFADRLESQPVDSAEARMAAAERNGLLTKPPGSLGRLEDLAIWYAGWRDDPRPSLERIQICVFAGNHGIAARGVSAFPPEVTVQMVANFEAGGAAINQLARTFGAEMSVVPLSLDTPTRDFTQDAAMTEEELVEALSAGWSAVDPEADLFVAGEMGIANTTAAAAIAAALFGGAAREWVGRGTGVDETGLALKAAVIEEALALHNAARGNPLEVLRCVGGREIAAMTGAMAAAREHRVPVILDGFIASSAAAVLHCIRPTTLDHVVAGHQSGEAAHGKLLGMIEKSALLHLGLRLGEGSGAAVAIGVLKAAIACHSGMATFAEAGVSDA